ncbi:uracil-DNA glycosylase family protein, partial [Klebsiella pneumoniae]|nr:uracil-DNA glycosylase family protein [Klebsiella pneumoniae]
MTVTKAISLNRLLLDIRACTVCAPVLPHAPRPIVVASADSRILIIGQAPGARVHASGIPWNDASGARLRTWLGVSDETFYDASKFALV